MEQAIWTDMDSDMDDLQLCRKYYTYRKFKNCKIKIVSYKKSCDK